MLLQSLIATLALTASVVKGTSYSAATRPAAPVVKGPHYASETRPASVVPASTLTDVTAVFDVSANVVVNLGPTFKDACKTRNTDVIVRGLVDVRSSILDLGAKINLGVGIWVGANINVFVDLYVNLLVKLQVLLKIIVAGGQSDACRTSIISLTSPLKAVLSVFINAGVDVHAMIGARVDLDLLASIGVSLGINANVGAGAILGSGINSKINVGAKAMVGSGSSAKATAAVSASTDVSAKFDLCANLMVKLGPSFEDACKTKNTNVIINGLVDLKASIVDLGAKVNVGVGVWVDADIKVFVNLYVQLMVKLQVLLKTISAGGQTDSCRDSILSLDAPLKVILTVFINAGIDVHAAIGVHVNLDFLASIGISLGINAQVGAQVGQKAGSGFGGLPKLN